MVTYEEIKTIVQTLYGDSIGAGSFIETDSGSPTELAILLNMVNNRISNYPREWPFTKATAIITVTGATSYDLKTLLPGFLSLYQVYGIDSNQEAESFSNAEGNITNQNGYTLKNGVLHFTGTLPQSSTFKIDYRTQYLVEDTNGNRKRYFEDSTDVSVLDYTDLDILTYGVGVYVNWKNDEVSKEKRAEVKDWFREAWTNMLLRSDEDRPLRSML